MTQRRKLGLVETPLALVRWMVGLFVPNGRVLRVLEPGCGDGRFLVEFKRFWGSRHELVGVDVRDVVLEDGSIRGVCADYLLWRDDEGFDLVIGNPPYGVIGDASHYSTDWFVDRKAEYRRRLTTWRGRYNLYGAFMEHSVNLLKPHGQMIVIVPSSWMVLDEFQRLRRFLAQRGGMEVFYLRRPFRGVSLNCTVVWFRKCGESRVRLWDWDRGDAPVVFEDYAGDWLRFETSELLAMERSGEPLGDRFRVSFAPRSTTYRAHPATRREPCEGCLPVLTGRNLRPNEVIYEPTTNYWFPADKVATLHPAFAEPHLVVAHTKGTRVVAAVDERCYPWREEFHLLPKQATEIKQVCTHLNSDSMQKLVGELYRNMVPHLTKRMLERLPIL